MENNSKFLYDAMNFLSNIKNGQLGIPAYSGQREFDEQGNEYVAVYNFKDKDRTPFFRVHKKSGIGDTHNLWHSNLQEMILRNSSDFSHEVPYYMDNGRKRIADLYYHPSKTIVELQHSSISIDELRQRTLDALEYADKIVWIFDASTHVTKARAQIKTKQDGITEWKPGYNLNRLTDFVDIEYGDRLFYRCSMPPSWSLLLTKAVSDELEVQKIFKYTIKQFLYSKFKSNYSHNKVKIYFTQEETIYCEDIDEDVDIMYLMELTNQFDRIKGKKYAKDLQKRYPYMVEFTMRHKDELFNFIESINPAKNETL